MEEAIKSQNSSLKMNSTKWNNWLPLKSKFALKFRDSVYWMCFTFNWSQFSLISTMGFDCLCRFHFAKKYSLQAFWDYLLFPEFLKNNKNILLSFKFEKIHFSENNIEVNIIVQENENRQRAIDIQTNYYKGGSGKTIAFSISV